MDSSYYLIFSAAESLDSAESAFAVDMRFSECLQTEYIKAYSHEVTVATAKECAVKCALGCSKLCDAYKVEGDKCKFIAYSHTPFAKPNPVCIPMGPPVATKLVKRAGKP